MDEFTDYLADLDHQANAAFAAERALEVAERARASYARVELVSRIWASAGAQISGVCSGGLGFQGTLRQTGTNWVLLETGNAQELIWIQHVESWAGLTDRALSEQTRPLATRLPVSAVLRQWGEQARPVGFQLTSGRVLVGEMQRVGADFVEVVVGRELHLLALHKLMLARQR